MTKRDSDAESEVSITIPAFNEALGIEETLMNLMRVFEDHETHYEIVVINHGSTDNSSEVLAKIAHVHKHIVVHNLPHNLGYGGGIMYGMQHSKGKYIGFTCADEEVCAEDVYRVFHELAKGHLDAAKSRRLVRKDGAFRKLTTTIFNSLISLRFKLKLKDINGYPLFIKRELFPLIKTEQIGYLFNLDVMRKIKKAHLSICEVPVTHCKRKKGKSYMKLSRIVDMAWGFLKYAF